MYKKRIELFLDIVKRELEPLPGLHESLERFKAAGLKLAAASSGAKTYTSLVLDKFEIRNYFESVVTGDDVTIGKPHPEAYIIAAKKLGLDPNQCLVLEDATKGIQSAKAAGCKCIAVKNSNIPTQDFSLADLVVPSLSAVTIDVIQSLD